MFLCSFPIVLNGCSRDLIKSSLITFTLGVAMICASGSVHVAVRLEGRRQLFYRRRIMVKRFCSQRMAGITGTMGIAGIADIAGIAEISLCNH